MKTKIGTEVAHVTRDSDTTFKVKRSRSQREGACRPPAYSLFEFQLKRYNSHKRVLDVLVGAGADVIVATNSHADFHVYS